MLLQDIEAFLSELQEDRVPTADLLARLKDVETRLLNWLTKRCPPTVQSFSVELGTTKRVLAAELVETSRLFARVAARVEPEWIEEIAGDRVTREWCEGAARE